MVDINYNYNPHIYNLRLNSTTFGNQPNKIWLQNKPDTFSHEAPESVPRETRAKIFSNEIIRLVEQKQLTAQKVQQAITKYVPNVKIKVVSMNEYEAYGVNKKVDVAAATRPKYDKNGQLQSIELFLPEINYDDEFSVRRYIENLTHEVTHAMQFAEDKEVKENIKDTPEGHFYNFFQQNINNMLIDTIVQKTLVKIAKEGNIDMNNLDDYENFIEAPNDEIGEEKLLELYGYNKKEFKNYIKTGFRVFIDALMEQTQVSRDPFAMKLIKESGGIEGFRDKIMKMVALTLANEQEGYQAGSNARKAARGFSGKDNNDAIPTIIGMMAEALAT